MKLKFFLFGAKDVFIKMHINWLMLLYIAWFFAKIFEACYWILSRNNDNNFHRFSRKNFTRKSVKRVKKWKFPYWSCSVRVVVSTRQCNNCCVRIFSQKIQQKTSSLIRNAALGRRLSIRTPMIIRMDMEALKSVSENNSSIAAIYDDLVLLLRSAEAEEKEIVMQFGLLRWELKRFS